MIRLRSAPERDQRRFQRPMQRSFLLSRERLRRQLPLLDLQKALAAGNLMRVHQLLGKLSVEDAFQPTEKLVDMAFRRGEETAFAR